MSFNSDYFVTAARGRVAFIQSCWHRDIVDRLRDSFLHEFSQRDGRSVSLFEVPGAYEIPLFAQALAQTNRYASVVAAGLIIDGGIYRHDFVASTVIDNLMRVQIDTGMPIFSAVLTPHHFHSNEEHHGFFKDHFVTKGKEVAKACASTLEQHRLI